MTALIHLRAGGVSLVLDSSDGRLPAVLHWGADLGELDAADLGALGVAVAPMPLPSSPDVPVRVSLVPEVSTGYLGEPGLVGSRAGGGDWSPRWLVSAVDRVGDGVTYRAADEACGLGLVVEVELTPQGLVRLRAAVTNLGEGDYDVTSLSVALPLPRRAREVLDLAGSWGSERHPQRLPLAIGQHRRENRAGRTGFDAPTVLHVGVPGFGFRAGEVWGVHVAWSGNHVHKAERTASGVQVLGGGELLLPGEGRLAPGETYATPWVFGGWGHGLDAVARRFHGWLRARRGHPDVRRPVTLNVWEAVYFDHSLERLTRLADLAAQVGVERFVLDDGWFGSRRDDTGGLGDWVVSPEAWPDGLGPLVEHVRGLGMQFGLWVEPEMVNADSDVARAHPDWVLGPGHGRLPVEARHQQVLDLTNPDAYAHVRDQLLTVLRENDISSLKWDHNRDVVDAGAAPVVHAQTLAAYSLMDELRAARPGLEMESCSSGGGRIDLEVLQRTDRVWTSDVIDPHERQRMLRWTGQLLPPELMGSHIASPRSHVTGRTHDLSFRAATAVFGHLGVEWDLGAASEGELAELAAWIGWWKGARSTLLGGELVRVDVPDADAWVHGVVTPARGIFSVGVGASGPVLGLGDVLLPGLDPEAVYEVRPVIPASPPMLFGMPDWFGGVRLPGRLLAEVGLRFPVMPPDQVLLVEAVRV